MSDVLKAKLSSRKLWMAIFMVMLVLGNRFLNFGLSQDDIKFVMFSGISYIVGEGVVDFSRFLKQ